ncbi:right-handed parallel beta-helix repeat-containing protein [Methanobacterium alcaliphilum]|uniref:right-handed parallel beta-helix repeat-containing protein n=1 Tax=Methanobacterium alcaliphilum TaxID=392018 RepID=UPI00200B8ACD|nr:right-handed parallel beta-helix repeat-containing protein [Methanobacterium alcaliphilum]MCK9151554.1 hypothetical protein [Methanobacterium alcaliphilum]
MSKIIKIITFIILTLSFLSIGMISAANYGEDIYDSTILPEDDVNINSSILSDDNSSKQDYSKSTNISEIYVSINGNDETGNGTIENPYKSLKQAISKSINGSTIYMSYGTYSNLNNTKLTIDKTLIISAVGGPVVLDGAKKYNFFEVTSNGNLTIDGLTFTNGDDENNYASGALTNYGDLTVLNSTFKNNVGLRSGAILNYGHLTVYNTTFISNDGTNYGGAISNFKEAEIYNCTFTENLANIGSALLNNGNITIKYSNFYSNTVDGVNYDNTSNSITIFNSIFDNVSTLNLKNTDTHIYNSSFVNTKVSYAIHADCSEVYIIGSVFDNCKFAINAVNYSNLTIIYSCILGSMYSHNSTINADYNWWGTNKKKYDVNYWIIMTFNSEYEFIPSKTDSKVTVSLNKYTDGEKVFTLTSGIYLPTRHVIFETDNGLFSNSGGYLENKSFSTYYINNTEDTLIYAIIDNQRLRLVVGTGSTDYIIYVSNDGYDYDDGSEANPYKTLSQALKKALNGNTIRIFAGEYDGAFNSNLYITKNLTFTSFNGPVTIYRHTNNNIFIIADYGQLNLNDITLSAPEISYAAYLLNNSGMLVINNCTIANTRGSILSYGDLNVYNSVFSDITGYAIYGGDGKNLNIINSYFTRISTNFENTVVYWRDGSVNLINSTFINNSLYALLLPVWSSQAHPVAVINASNFINNSGGLIFSNYGEHNHIIDNCKFINNTGACVKGAKSIINSIFINNSANGGIISNGDSYNGYNLTISNSSFINNANDFNKDLEYFYSNGMIYNGGNLTVDHCIFEGNYAGYGGAIFNNGNLTVSYSVFVNNTGEYLANNVFNRIGTSYLSFNWWGSSSGPDNTDVYRFLGDVYIDNWVIMDMIMDDLTVIASLNKVTDIQGNIHVLDGILPSRKVFFNGTNTQLSPLEGVLINNSASSVVNPYLNKDFIVKATIDNQILDLNVKNNSTMITVNNEVFYGKGNTYKVILSNVNGYLIANQTLKFTIKNHNGTLENYTLITDGNGLATIVINNTVGVYSIHVSYNGNSYFEGCQSNATISILTSLTKIITYNETFYGKGNVLYATLYDLNGKGVAGQTVTFNISYGNESKIYQSVTDESGRVGISINFSKGIYDVKISFNGNDWYNPSIAISRFSISSINSTLSLETSELYGRGNAYVVKLRDDNGNVIQNETIKLIISQGNINDTFYVITDENGFAGLTINLFTGVYNIRADYGGDSLYGSSSATGVLTINRVDTTLISDAVILDSNQYNITLTDIYGRPLAGESINITLFSPGKYNKTYTVITDSEGVARLTTNLESGNYILLNNFYENNWYAAATSASALIISKNINVESSLNVTISNYSIIKGNNVTLTARISTVGNYSDVTVKFYLDNSLIGTAKAVNGTASLNYNAPSSLALGSHLLRVEATDGNCTSCVNSTLSLISNTTTLTKYVDLYISSVKRSGNNYYFTIKNKGNSASKKCHLKMWYSSTKYKIVSVPVISSGGSCTVKVIFFTYSTHKNKYKYAKINFNQKILESNYNNNQITVNKPDLYISSVKRSGNKYKFRIKNKGAAASSKCYLKVWYNSKRYKIVKVPVIVTGGYCTIMVNFYKYSTHKRYYKYALINYKEKSLESNYKNNQVKFK